MTLQLRDYQRDAVTAINEAEQRGVRRPLVVHPTGTGKTVTFSNLIATRHGRSIVLVHRDELARQTQEKIELVAPELSVGIVKAERDEHDADVVIASVQTASRDNRLARLSGFSTVVCDEAHHVPAPSWRKILEHLGSFTDTGPLTVGFTATPERDKGALGVWQEVVAYKSIREMIFADYLAPITGQTVETDADLAHVGVSHGDLVESDLGHELERSGALGQIADAYVQYAKDRKGVAFCPTVATAHSLAEALATRGIAAEGLDGSTPIEQRHAILHRLHTGETQVVANCAVLTEGFDEPSISCVVVARPTRFHGLYVQMVGRGTRKHPGKTDLLVLDVTGASTRHDLVAVVDLGLEEPATSTRKVEPGAGYKCTVCGVACGEATHFCRLCNRPLPAAVIADGGRRHDNCRASRTGRVDPFATSKLRWLPVDGGFCLGAGKDVLVMAPIDDGELWQLATYSPGSTNRVEVLHRSLPIDWAQGIGEDRAKAFGRLAARDARWLASPPTEAQLSRLVREGLPESKVSRIRTRGQAADLITRIQARRALRRLARKV